MKCTQLHIDQIKRMILFYNQSYHIELSLAMLSSLVSRVDYNFENRLGLVVPISGTSEF